MALPFGEGKSGHRTTRGGGHLCLDAILGEKIGVVTWMRLLLSVTAAILPIVYL